MTPHYPFKDIEKKWQDYWDKHRTFATEDFGNKPKYYVLDMFPYPSGNGLHVGHVEGYTATDIVARYKKHQGFNVLHPMGWDAFGLPAEQYAVKTGTHPAVTTQVNVKRFKEQIKSFGYATDWSREVDTTKPSYYKWTQWIFAQLYKKGLAYESNETVNWCEELGTVLANEEVVDGRSEVGNYIVVKKPMRQWILKITEYAERLLQDLDDLDWPESTKEMQRHWIGKSVGSKITFQVDLPFKPTFQVFTTCPHTIFGVTFCILAPEHPLISQITTPEQRDIVSSYVEEASRKTQIERSNDIDGKTGVFLGSYALHPLTGERLPIYVADYVFMNYGTGSVMGVPAHDERDQEFATKYGIAIKTVMNEEGKMIHSSFLDDLAWEQAFDKSIEHLESVQKGHRFVTYRLRDWVFSRQRYWGEPFPIAHDEDGNVHLINEEEFPILLPPMDDFKPTKDGKPPLSKATDWVNITRDGKKMQRETNIMPQWAGSCWYYLRYLDPYNEKAFCDPEKESHWLPVDLYVGGAEHANLHLLYARFWHKVLFDLKLVSTKEPFKRIVHQGLILGSNGEKMSKSVGNIVNPDDVIAEWGADSIRLFEMFLGPLEQPKPWQTQGITGVHRFLKRVWRLFVTEEAGALTSSLMNVNSEISPLEKALHKTIKKVTEDTEALRFNTAIACMMEFVNQVYKDNHSLTRSEAERFLILLSPYAPHMAEELWEALGHKESISAVSWPVFNPDLVVEDTVVLPIMVNGKHRGNITVSKLAQEAEVMAQAKALDSVAKFLVDQQIVKAVFVPLKVINFVVK